MTTRTKYKKCAQCGCVKPESDFKIKYTRADGTKLRNTCCRLCEEDTRNYRALKKLLDAHCITTGQEKQLNKYVEVFRLLESQGLSTPLSRKNDTQRAEHGSNVALQESHLDSILQRYEAAPPMDKKAEQATRFNKVEAEVSVDEDVAEELEFSDAAVQGPTESFEVPDDLQVWLIGTFDDWKTKMFTPEYLNESVYPALKSAYRKEVGWNAVTLTPEYDDTYKTVLNKISDRFWDYEDWYRLQERTNEDGTDNGTENSGRE